jgi:ribosomal protein S18 acetylase RimI-like enzyme
MTDEEFGRFRERAIREYAAEQVRIGTWSPEQAERQAEQQTDGLLPAGLETPDMVLLVAERAGEVVGLVWSGAAPAPHAGWWIYDLEVVPEQRGRGYGRALLEAAEHEAERRGEGSIGLNVFGGNVVARNLYDSAGYQVTAVRMRKRLSR